MRIVPLHAFVSTIASTISLAACGGGTRHLQAISVSPATATGSAQFTAKGMFSEPPSPVVLTTPQVAWCAGTPNGTCAEAINVPATVDASGTTQCLPGKSGTVTIVAFDPSTKPPQPVSRAQIFETATITCP